MVDIQTYRMNLPGSHGPPSRGLKRPTRSTINVWRFQEDRE
jgi:hypothetical protein